MTIIRELPEKLGIIAGNGAYPRLLADAARKAGVQKIVAAAFTDETDPALDEHVNVLEWMRVGQLGRLLKCFRSQDIQHAIMAGQIAPKKAAPRQPKWHAWADWLVAKIAARPDIYLRELQAALKRELGEEVCLGTICAACRVLEQSRKKRL